jgi:DNA-binding response OmpR family regulator
MNAEGRPKAAILVVDDEQIVHESVQRILEDEGFSVDGALRVDKALELLQQGSYDLVITDLMMPDRSGMDAVRAVAQDHPDAGVVMFTGFATVDSAVESMKLGALDYLPKPFTPEELLKVVHRSLDRVRKGRRDREIEQTYADAEKALRSSLDLKEILNLIASSVVRLLKVKGATVLLFKKKDRILEVAASYGLSDEYVEKGLMDSTRSISQVFDCGEPVLVQAEEFDSSLHYPAAARTEGIMAILSVPLKVEGTIIGFLRLYSAGSLSLGHGEMDLLMKFAEQASRALENAMSYERVRSDIEGMKKYIPASVTRSIDGQG